MLTHLRRMLTPGKLPVDLLKTCLALTGASDSRVLIGPRFGEDCAVIDLGAQYLITKTDPVTFTAEEIGWYAVHVNANDVATMGDRKSTRLNSSHITISYAVFCLKKKTK